MDKDNIKTWYGFALIVVLVVGLFTFTSHLIRKTQRETKEIERRVNEPQKVITKTQPSEGKNSLSDLGKSIERGNRIKTEEDAAREARNEEGIRRIEGAYKVYLREQKRKRGELHWWE